VVSRVQPEETKQALSLAFLLQTLAVVSSLVFIFLKGCEYSLLKQIFNRFTILLAIVILPLSSIYLQVMYNGMEEEQSMQIFLWFYLLVNCLNAVYLFFMLAPILNKRMGYRDFLMYPFRGYFKEKKPNILNDYDDIAKVPADRKAEYAEEVEKQRPRHDYNLIKREIGEGPRRIGSTLNITEDIYSMFYVSTIKSDYIHFWNLADIKDGDDESEIERKI
jgi:hypothetical protein